MRTSALSRRAAVAAVAAALLAPAHVGAQAAGPAPVLGAAGLMGPSGEGWGTRRPPRVSNGGVPYGNIENLRWHSWGDRRATGRGRKSVYRPGGGYYDEQVPVRVRALRVRTCPTAPDLPAYTRMIVSHRVRPGGPWTAWAPWTLDLCDFAARPRACRPVEGAPGDARADGITAWDVRCRVARRLARASLRYAGRSDGGGARYTWDRSGFVCSGYALPAAPRIAWTCHRRTAQVTFRAPLAAHAAAPI